MQKEEILNKIHGGLIVSCQALEDEPLHSSIIMSRMANAAKIGGAVGIRANTVEDILEIRKMVELPIIGIIKRDYSDSEIYISPTLKEIQELIDSPAEIIALDATLRRRPKNEKIESSIEAIKKAGKIAMADISTYEEGIEAYKKGFDIISTTLSGYTPYSPQIENPDYELIKKLSRDVNIPVIAEGRVFYPEQLIKCFGCGAYCVVVGAAITRPQTITKHFVRAINEYKMVKSDCK